MEEKKENDDAGWLVLASLERLTKGKNKLHDENLPTSEMTHVR